MDDYNKRLLAYLLKERQRTARGLFIGISIGLILWVLICLSIVWLI